MRTSNADYNPSSDSGDSGLPFTTTTTATTTTTVCGGIVLTATLLNATLRLFESWAGERAAPQQASLSGTVTFVGASNGGFRLLLRRQIPPSSFLLASKNPSPPFSLQRLLAQSVQALPLFCSCTKVKCAVVEGDKGPEVASVWVVKPDKDSIQHHNGLPAEEGNERRLSPPLDTRVDRVHRLRPCK